MIRSALSFTLAPSPAPELDPDTVTPGVLGFFAIFFVAGVVVLLMVDMTRRIRRTRYRGEIAERLDAEEEAREQTERDDQDRVIRPLDFDVDVDAADDVRDAHERPDRDRPIG